MNSQNFLEVSSVILNPFISALGRISRDAWKFLSYAANGILNVNFQVCAGWIVLVHVLFQAPSRTRSESVRFGYVGDRSPKPLCL
jgi:hypothetical protein